MTVVTQILNRMPFIPKPQRKFLLALFATMLYAEHTKMPIECKALRQKPDRQEGRLFSRPRRPS